MTAGSESPPYQMQRARLSEGAQSYPLQPFLPIRNSILDTQYSLVYYSPMASNPLKPLIKGMFVMLAVVAVVLLATIARLALIAEQERVAEAQKRSKEINERFQKTSEENYRASKLRREQEAARVKKAAESQPKKETP